MNGNFITTEIPSHSAASEQNGPQDTRRLLLIASLITLGLYFVPYSNYLLYPLRLFVTFIHESGHALAAIISGGAVKYLQVHPNGEGVTWSATPDWAQWLGISGGYMGTTIFGALLLQVGRFTRLRSAGRTALYVIAGYLLTVTLLWAHNPFDNLFTLVTGVLLSVGIFAAARFASPRVAAFLASFLAVQCCLSALGDIRILLYLTTNAPGTDNDAVFMSQHYPLPPTFWALSWAAMSVVILCASLWSYLRATARHEIPTTALSSYPR